MRIIAGHIGFHFGLAMAILTGCACSRSRTKTESLPVDAIVVSVMEERPVDTLLTKETRELWNFLRKLPGRGILFGHQDATVSGIDWRAPASRCDVQDLTGTRPALYGWEISGIGKVSNIDSIPFALLQKRIVEAFERNAINTVTWHLDNPVTGGNAWDTSPACGSVLPDSSHHEVYKAQLRYAANFFLQLKTSSGVFVPVIFRPFHENNGSWFWWGKDHCTPEEYIRLWQFTVSYLDSLGVHNLLYAYSTDMFETPEQYLERYPGDPWVDIVGMENYWDFQSGATISNGIAQLRMLTSIASERNKVAALTECGFDGIPVKNWWTQYLLTPIRDDSAARNIAYLMVWRNSNRKHYYVPFADHKSAPDFRLFEKDPYTLFEKDLREVYGRSMN